MKIQLLSRLCAVLPPLAMAAAMSACGGDSGNTDTPPAAAEQPAPATASQTAADDASTAFGEDHVNYRLTMPAVRRWFEAQKNVYRAIAANPELADEVDSSDVSEIDELADHFGNIPEVREAVTQAGLDMREYASILAALYFARGVDAAIQDGADRAAMIANEQVDPANLELVEQNRSELDRLQGELEALEGTMR